MDVRNHKNQLALLTDFYEFTMAASYFKHRPQAWASFDLFIRDLPKERSFFLAAGLSDVIDYLQSFHFDDDSIQYLESLNVFSEDFLGFLRRLKFSGDLWAIPEGEVFFPNEPVIRIVAPLIEAQLLESCLLNIINLQTTIATKAARIVLTAGPKSIFDFSLRRTHGSDAALKVARSSYIAGFKGTSNVLAGKVYGIPVVGTMAHSYVMAYKSELESFRSFVDTFAGYSTLLVDTYDTQNGIENAITIARELEQEGRRLTGVRLDSGDLIRLSVNARHQLDKAGLSYVKIFASGNLDEYTIKNLVSHKAPVDSFGVGTKMGTSADYPYCDVIYKLNEVTDLNGDFIPTMKLSKGKATYPGRKQVFRFTDRKGIFQKDTIGLENENIGGKPLLTKIIEKGNLIYREPALKDVRDVAAENISKLPNYLKSLRRIRSYPIHMSPQLKALTQRVSQKIRRRLRY